MRKQTIAFLVGIVGGVGVYRAGFVRGWQARTNVWNPLFLQAPFKHMLQSKLCAGCGSKKGHMTPFCKACFLSLPQSHKMNLYAMLQRGWIAQFESSLSWLHTHRVQPIVPSFKIFTKKAA